MRGLINHLLKHAYCKLEQCRDVNLNLWGGYIYNFTTCHPPGKVLKYISLSETEREREGERERERKRERKRERERESLHLNSNISLHSV